MKSRNGIFYDLNFSTYKVNEKGLTYVFSSELHRNKFNMKKIENRENICRSLSKRFKIKIELSILADIVLYQKIETRGFLVVLEDGTKLCQNDLILDGEKAMLRSLKEY